MTETLRQFIESASAKIEQIFHRTGRVLPMWHCVKADGTWFVLPAPAGDKDTSAMMARVLFELENVVRCMFIDEAWAVDTGDTDDPTVKDELLARVEEGRGIADHPLRREIIAFAAEDQNGGSLTAHRAIIRPAHGKARLGPLHIDDNITRSEGRLVGMLRAPAGTKVQ